MPASTRTAGEGSSRGDHPADADRLVHHFGDDGRVVSVDDAPGVLVGELREVLEAADDVVHVDLSLDEALAGVEGLSAGELVLALDELLRDLQQKLTALRSRSVGPDAESNVFLAAAMAASASWAPASETMPTSEPSAGQMMVRVSPEAAETHSPSMNRVAVIGMLLGSDLVGGGGFAVISRASDVVLHSNQRRTTPERHERVGRPTLTG